MKTPPLYERPKRDSNVRQLVLKSTEFILGMAAAMGCTEQQARDAWRDHSFDMMFIEKVDALMGGRNAGVKLGDKLKADRLRSKGVYE